MPDDLQISSQSTPSHPRSSLLTDAIKQVDLIHITLMGMAGIVLLLYGAALLPVLGMQPVTSVLSAIVMGIAAISGMVVLYVMNFRVHKNVTSQARLTEVLVNSLGQGFLTFDRKAQCGSMYSQACIEMLEQTPAGMHLADMLHVPAVSRDDFLAWIEVLFDPTHALGFDDAVRFLPQTFPHSAKRNIALAYKPIRNEHNVLTHVVLIATDRTEETAAQSLAEQQQHFANMICKIFKERNQFVSTVNHIREFIAFTVKPNLSLRDIPTMLRQLHTLKAAVRHFSLMKFGELIHEIETQMRNSKIDTEDDFRQLALAAHKVIEMEFSNVLLQVRGMIAVEDEQRGTLYEISEESIYTYADYLKSKYGVGPSLQKYLAEIAALPIRSCFLSFERELIELAQQMDKNLKPVIYTGDNLRVLALPWQPFFFSLTHMSRNIIDHGIEPPVTRMARGKDAAGQIGVHVEQQTDASGQQWAVIEIGDDGAGIDPNRVRQKLAAIDPEGSWRFDDDQKVIQRIFVWGISTRDGISEISGHGVGLEAVMQEVKKLGGNISVTSEIYRGTKFTIRLPYVMDV
ncbi:MAG: ATP-binding protein [Alphaproteobacteria bacterium]